MVRRRFVAIVAGALLGVGVLGVGVVGARTDRPQFSDEVRFSGVAFPGSVPGSYTFTSQMCSLASDPVSPGAQRGHVRLPADRRAPRSGRTGTATVTSPDGTTTWSFAPAPGQDKGEGSRDIVGKGSEHDAPEANAPTSTATASPVNVSGSMNVIDTHLGFLLVTGSARFSESGTAP